MSRGAARIRVDPLTSYTLEPIPVRQLEIASLARKPPGQTQPAERQFRSAIRLKVSLSRSELGLPPERDYFLLKLHLARTLRRKLRVAIVEVDDCEKALGTGDPFELKLEPPDAKRLTRLRAAVRRLLRASQRVDEPVPGSS